MVAPVTTAQRLLQRAVRGDAPDRARLAEVDRAVGADHDPLGAARAGERRAPGAAALHHGRVRAHRVVGGRVGGRPPAGASPMGASPAGASVGVASGAAMSGAASPVGVGVVIGSLQAAKRAETSRGRARRMARVFASIDPECKRPSRPHCGAHAPWRQIGGAHARPHRPQWRMSPVRSTERPPQHDSPAAQIWVAAAAVGRVGLEVAQAPLQQTAPSAQARPHQPQWRVSRDVSAHTTRRSGGTCTPSARGAAAVAVDAARRFAARAAAGPCRRRRRPGFYLAAVGPVAVTIAVAGRAGAPVRRADTVGAAGGAATPQCAGSLARLTQETSQPVWPAGHTSTQSRSPQTRPSAHRRPQAPQCAGSLVTSTQASPQSRRSRGPGGTRRRRPRRPGPARHRTPQAPQCSGSRRA